VAANYDLRELFQEVQLLNELPEDDISLTGIKIDSREIQPGNLYLAIQGTSVNGHHFISNAISQGAASVVGTDPAENYLNLKVPYLQVEDTRTTLADLAAAWFDYPARNLVIVGVTGTDGKTTTVNLIHQILIAAGLNAGLISTVNAVIGNKILDTGFHVTTPGAMDVQYYLTEMVNAGITHVVLEATSHGLAQKRVASCEFDIGVITNITHEHLDFHGDFRGYLEAKSELIRLVASSKEKTGRVQKLAVLNRDDQSFSPLLEIVSNLDLSWVDYGKEKNSSAEVILSKTGRIPLRAQNIRSESDGIDFVIQRGEEQIPIQTSLLGEYNVSNCLAAAAACVEGLGLSWEVVQQGIKNMSGIPGRMQRLDLGQDFLAIVDFAHTPNALRVALSAARALTSKKVIAVFGSAGLRDREKRRLMAEVSAELADLTILTAEDPRTESLEGILEEMAAGVRSKARVEGEDFWRVPDRGEAIRFGLGLAQTGDVVMVCGKGHEQSMCFEEIEYPWDDSTATRSALADLLKIEGPKMPFLPTRSE